MTMHSFSNFGVTFLLCSLLSTGVAFAGGNGAYCDEVQVIQVGGNSVSGKIVQLNNTTECGTWPINTPRWYVLYDGSTPPQGNAMLAAALTAKSADQQVFIVPANGNIDEWNYIVTLYVK